MADAGRIAEDIIKDCVLMVRSFVEAAAHGLARTVLVIPADRVTAEEMDLLSQTLKDHETMQGRNLIERDHTGTNYGDVMVFNLAIPSNDAGCRSGRASFSNAFPGVRAVETDDLDDIRDALGLDVHGGPTGTVR